MRLEIAYIAMAFVIAGYAVAEYRGRRGPTKPGPGDTALDLTSTVLITGAVGPAVLFASEALSLRLAPGSQGLWAGLPWPVMFLCFLIGDDLVQYGWHRLSHSVPFLYTLHRAHHSAGYMGIRMIYRNNVLYYALMPNLWISGVLLHLGLWPVYPYYVILKLTVIAGAHSSVHWDAFLYRDPRLHRIAWIIERVFSTPATHNAHHGQHASDEHTFYKGNYGNLLFLWDVLFGTARITRGYPERYGIENLPAQPWHTELFWPLIPLRHTPNDEGAKPPLANAPPRSTTPTP